MYIIWWENTILVEQCTGFSRGSSGIRIKPGLGQWLNTRGDAKIFVNVKKICSCKLLSMMCFTLKQLHLHRKSMGGHQTWDDEYHYKPWLCMRKQDCFLWWFTFVLSYTIYCSFFKFIFLLEICSVLVELPLYILMLFFCDDSSIHERLPLKSHSV